VIYTIINALAPFLQAKIARHPVAIPKNPILAPALIEMVVDRLANDAA